MGMAIGRSLCELSGRAAAIAGRLVLDDKRLMQRFRKPIGDRARHKVKLATGAVVTIN